MSDTKDGHETRASEVIARVERLADLAEQRWQLAVEAERVAGLDAESAASPAATLGPRDRARELRDHARTFLLPRARDLDAPLLVAIVGPTGSGKSSLMNTLAGGRVSRTGVLRPTTRDAVAVGTETDLGRLVDGGALASIPAARLERHLSTARPGVVIVDAPDVDSVEHDDRALADRLLEAADLCLFVTTATRYADRVPWDVLRRAEERGLPLIVVLNRMPAGQDAQTVREDVQRLIEETRLRVSDILLVAEGALDAARPTAEEGSAGRAGSHADGTGSAIDPGAVDRLLSRLGQLSDDREARRALAADALAGALAGIAPLASSVATDLEREARQVEALHAESRQEYEAQAELMFERLFSGSVLREEVLRHWHSFVGADQVTRIFASGIGRIRGTLASILRGTPRAPVAVVQEGAADDITALVASHADEAARRTAGRWSDEARGAPLVAAHPELWSSSPALEGATRAAMDGWVASIASDVAERGARRRGPARIAALGVNGVAITIMLVTFTHTGGITGAEAGIAAATAFLNQKLLNALFGEAAVQEMLRRARHRLREALSAIFGAERERFEALIPPADRLRDLAVDLRAAAA